MILLINNLICTNRILPTRLNQTQRIMSNKEGNNETNLSFETLCSREVKELRYNKPHILPIYASSSFVFDNTEHSMSVFTNKEKGHLYSRYANPTVDSVSQKLAELETFDTEIKADCFLTNSGMSAISLVLTSQLKSGDKVLTQGDLYGGTTELLNKIYSNFNIEAITTDLTDTAKTEEILKQNPDIAMIYAETPANPSLRCIDLTKLASLAKSYGVLTVVDNTFCTPYLQRPLEHGIDIVIHSTTKSLNGHGNSIGGAVIADQKFTDSLWTAYKLIGLNPSPFDAWLLHNGMKTLTLRVKQACFNALAIAQYLELNEDISVVNYPGLPNHPSHQIACKQMSMFGSMLSFELKGGFDAGKQFMDSVNMITLAPTLGDLDTLLLHPASSSHLNIDKAIREANGITDGLIRMSVGIEDETDLINDIRQAIHSIDKT